MSMSMRALVIETDCVGSRDKNIKTRTASKVLKSPKVSIVDMSMPVVGPTDILIKVHAVGLCGSDVAMASADETGFVRYPFMMASRIIPGHEFSGVVSEIGKDVEQYWHDLKLGDPVTAQCVINCGFCPSCKVGEFDHCPNGDELGFTLNGGMAEYCVVNMKHVWSLKPLADVFSWEDLFIAGSLVELHTGVYKAITENDFKPGSNVLVIGAGPIGLAALSVFQALGAAKIFVVEISKRRRRLAESLGAFLAFDPTEESISEFVLDETNNRGVSCVFEAAGVAEKNWTEIISLLDNSEFGPIVIFFGQSKIPLTINPQLFIQRYLRFSGSHGHSNVWPTVIELFGSRRINSFAMATKSIVLDEGPKWIKELEHNKDEGKVTITSFKERC